MDYMKEVQYWGPTNIRGTNLQKIYPPERSGAQDLCTLGPYHTVAKFCGILLRTKVQLSQNVLNHKTSELLRQCRPTSVCQRHVCWTSGLPTVTLRTNQIRSIQVVLIHINAAFTNRKSCLRLQTTILHTTKEVRKRIRSAISPVRPLTFVCYLKNTNTKNVMRIKCVGHASL